MIHCNLADFVKRITPFLEDGLTDTDVLNNIFDPFVERYKIRNKNGERYQIDPASASRLMTGKDDVPNKIRDSIQHNDSAVVAEMWAKNNFGGLKRETLNDMVDSISSLYEGDASSKSKMQEMAFDKTGDPFRFFAITLIGALLADNRVCYQRHLLWTTQCGSLSDIEADLLSLAFNKKLAKTPKIIVVPVDSNFTTTVDEADVFLPKVSPKSLHGKFLLKLFAQGEDLKNTKCDINKSLENQGYNPEDSQPIGSIAALKRGKIVFYLLATSTFDKNNNAHSSKEDIINASDCLASYYARNGQGFSIYVPLIGTGLSRAGLTAAQSLEILHAAFSKYENEIFGDANIVKYHKC